MKIIRSLVFAIVGILLANGGCGHSVCNAQLFGSGEEYKISSAMVPESAQFGVVLFPQAMGKLPELEMVPREVITAQGIQSLGFDPMKIEQLVLTMDQLDFDDMEQMRFGVVFHFSEIQGLGEELLKRMEKSTIAGKQAFVDRDSYRPMAFVIVDEVTIAMGFEDYLNEMLTKPGGALAKLMADKPVDGPAMGFVDVRTMRDAADQLGDRYPKMPEPLAGLLELPKLIDSLSLSGTPSPSTKVNLKMKAVNADAAEEAKEVIAQSLTFLHAMLVDEMSKQLNTNDPVQAATVQYVDRVWNKYQDKMVPQVNGEMLSIELHEEVLALPFLMAFLGQSMERVIDPPVVAQNRLRQTALAALNYESAYQKLPPQVVTDEDGRPLYSGAVRMLPFMEQMSLYEQIDQTQAWNSPANRELLESTLVPMFDANEDSAGIRFPVFPGSVWDGDAKSLGEVTDGTSNTILAIDAPPGLDLHWADPTPWKISESNPKRDIFGDRERVRVVFMDGSTHVLEASETTNDQLKAMLTIGGGERVEIPGR